MNRRHLYRVSFPAHTDIEVRVRTEGDPVVARPVNLSDSGIMLEVSEDARRNLRLGAPVTLGFRSRASGSEADAEGVVIHVGAVDRHTWRAGIKFADPDRLAREAAPMLRHLLNRRSAVRVRPPVDMPLKVCIRIDDLDHPAVVLDISACGIGLAVPLATDRSLRTHAGIALVIGLPDGEEPVLMRGAIRRSTLRTDKVFYGIEFSQETDSFPRKTERLARFVTLCDRMNARRDARRVA